MSTRLQVINTAVSRLLAQADAALTEEPDKVDQLLEWLDQMPGLDWGLAVFALVAMAVTVIAKLTGNLDEILSFKDKYFSQSQAELDEQLLGKLRRQLLQQMKTDVAQRLEDSLHNLVKVDLEREEQRHQVGRQKPGLVKSIPKQTHPWKSLINKGLAIFKQKRKIDLGATTEKTYKIFLRNDIGQRLLILGEPGSGKTTELLTVTEHLIEDALQASSETIPVIFELSSWTPKTPIISWFGEQLSQKYGVSHQLANSLAKQWVQKNQLLPLLDGLDELGQQNQVACISELEKFLAQHRALPALICCRREEYEQGGQQLRQLNGAIYLQPVGSEQMRQFFKNLGRESLWAEIKDQPELLELARSPLFLAMLVVAYQGQTIRDQAALFDAYIQKQLHDPSHQGTYKPGQEKSPQQILHYLCWLAKQLERRNETEFLIENLQPSWLSSRKPEHAYRAYRLIFGLFFGPFFGLLIGFSAGFSGGPFFGLLVGLTAGLVTGLLAGLTRGVIAGLLEKLSGSLDVRLKGGVLFNLATGLSRIRPVEKLKWIPYKGLTFGLVVGLAVGLIAGTMFGLSSGISIGLTGGLFAGIGGGFDNAPIQTKVSANQGIRRSLWNGLTMGLIIGLGAGILFGLLTGPTYGLSAGLMAGLMVGLMAGVIPVIQHCALRTLLTKSGNMPWNYEKFLEHTVKHRFIQRTGGRYRFVHDLLRQHFAQMTPQQQAALAHPPRHNG